MLVVIVAKNGRGSRTFGSGAGRCPMCGASWDGRVQRYGQVSRELPRPNDEQWVAELREALGLEEFSEAQYERDVRAHGLERPYRMVVPQERNHIAWIAGMFGAYGLSPDAERPEVRKTPTAVAALELGLELEADLAPRYERLILRAQDRDSADILDTILLQTRMHYAMFDHALRMGCGVHGMTR